jgi:uncharacterized secreted protein with C-terminal beta-propeller domain
MKTLFFLIATAFTITVLPSCASVSGDTIPPVRSSGWDKPTGKTMRAFRSEAELTGYLRDLAEMQKREQARRRGEAATKSAGLANAEALAPAETKDGDESITNTQHAGVDEGGIVKLHGDHLVVLRRPVVHRQGWLGRVGTGIRRGCIWSGHRSQRHLVRRNAGG